jgi:hypothetical protein
MACAVDATDCGSLAGNADFHFWTQGAACIVLDLKEERLGNECKAFISDNGGIKGLLDCSNALVRNCASPSKDMATGSCLASAGFRDIIGDRCVDIAYAMGVKLDLGLEHPRRPANTIQSSLGTIANYYDNVSDVSVLIIVWLILLIGAIIFRRRSWITLPVIALSRNEANNKKQEEPSLVSAIELVP